MSFVWAKAFNILITHLKVPVITPIDQNHQKNAFSGDNVEQGENATFLNVKWLWHLSEMEPESAHAERDAGAQWDPASADTASSAAKTETRLLSLCYSLLDLRPEDQTEQNSSSDIPVTCSIKPKLHSNELVEPAPRSEQSAPVS